MRGEILGPVASAIGGAILPRGAGAGTLLWSIAGTTQITEEAANATYTVSYSNALAPGQSATIAVASAAGTATDGVDYTGAATTLTFTAGGATAKTLSVTIIEDTDVEGTEDFSVTLGSPSAGQLATSQVNTAIADEDVVLSTFLLDTLSGAAVQAYSMRKLRAAYSGNCVRLRRSTDSAESNFGFDGSGDLDTAAIASWLGGATGFVTTWYDQSGNGRDAVQAHVSHQPTYGPSLVNSIAAIGFIGNDRFAMSRPSPSVTWTALAVVRKDSAADGMVICDNVQNRQHRINVSGGANVSLYAGTTLTLPYGGDVTVPHLYEWENRGSNIGQIWVDGSSLGVGDPGSGSLGSDEIGTLTAGGSFINGKIAEVIVFCPNLSDADRSIAEADVMSYWEL